MLELQLERQKRLQLERQLEEETARRGELVEQEIRLRERQKVQVRVLGVRSHIRPVHTERKRTRKRKRSEEIKEKNSNIKVNFAFTRFERTLKPCSHLTYAFAFASNIKNGFYGNSVMVFALNICILKNRTAKIKEKCQRRC